MKTWQNSENTCRIASSPAEIAKPGRHAEWIDACFDSFVLDHHLLHIYEISFIHNKLNLLWPAAGLL